MAFIHNFIFFIDRFEPAANGIPSSVFFPQSDPEDRLSQCSASLQALLALSPTTVHALSKLVNSVEISDDIIGVIRSVVAKYPTKGCNDQETSIEVPLSVRLWRISGCHELLASLGFDLMEVGQDQVTLRTGKQANRRQCQFVLQALLALFDTQEAPKSLGIDSSSSCESLNDEPRSADQPMPSAPPPPQQQRSISPVGTVKSMKMARPPLPTIRGSLLRGNGSGSGAFISYVRRRGEPDGGRPDAEPTPSASASHHIDSSLANTTDSDLSDSYTSQSQTLNRFENKPKMSYSSLRTPIRIGHPSRGGESDATFTPSPPVTNQNVDNNVSLALAHQTRIRNLYSGGIGDMQMKKQQLHRPDSSSSASSTTDWEGSGQTTVLRRAAAANQNGHMLPPLPPPRQTMPLVDSLRPLAPIAPVYNNLNSANSNNNLESTSSDSEFERGLEKRGRATKQKPLQQQFMSRKLVNQMVFMDRLSVRTEVSGATALPIAAARKPSTLPEDDESNLTLSANNLYFTTTDTEDEPQQTKDTTVTSKNATKETKLSANKNIQDSIMRQMNREMTPTISDVYHERNLGLGLAPPLSKLLLSKNYDDVDTKMSSSKSTLSETTSDMDLSISTVSSPSTNGSTNTERCALCNGSNDVVCSCKSSTTSNPKMTTMKPWLSNVEPNMIRASEMSTADLLERQAIINKSDSTASSKRNSSPFSELSRRDEGDGRSVADSNCSSNYKSDVTTTATTTTTKMVDIQQRINQFNLGAAK